MMINDAVQVRDVATSLLTTQTQAISTYRYGLC